MTIQDLLNAFYGARDTARKNWTAAQDAGGSDPRAFKLHESLSKDALLTAQTQGMHPLVADALISLLGVGNEMATGLAYKAMGGDFFSPSGFDIGDISANERGLQMGMSEIVEGLARKRQQERMARLMGGAR